MKIFLTMLLMMALFAVGAEAAATSFTTALPSSLMPDGFWTLVALVFGVVVTMGGIVMGIKLMKRARG